MTKADIVKNISDQTGMDKTDVQMIAEKFMDEIKNSLQNNNNVYLRGFGSFIIKTRAEKTGRNISQNTAVIIKPVTPANYAVISNFRNGLTTTMYFIND